MRCIVKTEYDAEYDAPAAQALCAGCAAFRQGAIGRERARTPFCGLAVANTRHHRKEQRMLTRDIEAPHAVADGTSPNGASRFDAYDPRHIYRGCLLLFDNEARYRADCIELALTGDNVDMIRECIERGWLTPESRTLFNDTVRHRAAYLNRTRIDAYLESLGWPD